MRKAKIVCTLGPAVGSTEKIRELVDAGMDVARLNMSHGSYEDHERNYRLVRQASDESGHGVGIFADLQGPKIRLERFADGPVKLKKGQQWTITTRDVPGDAVECGTTYKGLPGDVHAGDPILIDDGKVRLVVDSVDGAGRAHAPSWSAARSATTRASTCPAWPCRCPRCRRRTSRTCAGPCGSASTSSR